MVRLACVALLLTGCLDDPVLTECADFPAGTSGCPDRRDVYCELVLESCPDNYADLQTCKAAASELVAGEVNETVGNTIECRIEFAQRSLEDPNLCDAASESGGLTCIPAECSELCSLVTAQCENAYPTPDHCAYMCRNYPRGSDADGENTLECRLRYAREGNCEASHTNGGDICGDPCEMYCKLEQQNCATADVSLYDSQRQCRTACELLDPAGPYDDWQFSVEGDTVQCRTYHLGLPSAEFPADHCHHAGLFDTAHCGTDEDQCEVFCSMVERHCDGLGNRDACKTFCRALPELALGAVNDIPCDRLR